PIFLGTLGGVDALNISDLGSGVARTFSVSRPNIFNPQETLVTATGVANIDNDDSDGPGSLHFFTLTGSTVGGNVYNIQNTTATDSNTVNDGASGASGASTFNIQADKLQAGASNSFNGFDGNDVFEVNFAAGTSISSAAGTTLSIDGGGGVTSTTGDRVNVNANLGGDGSRIVGINYGAGNAVAVTGLGTDSAGPGIQVSNTRQVNYFGDSANDDALSVSGAATGGNVISVTPLTVSSANVFLGGAPLLTIPPGSTGSNNPGVAGGGAGPDLFVGGIALTAFSVSGGSTGAGNGNRMVVNGKSEDINGAGGTSAWGGNAFGSPADTVT